METITQMINVKGWKQNGSSVDCTEYGCQGIAKRRVVCVRYRETNQQPEEQETPTAKTLINTVGIGPALDTVKQTRPTC